jgi:acetolactate decarboxylase
MALSQCLGRPIHTLFQVSTSAALVEGLYQGAARVSRLLRHGDFGLGTFIDLDGEMIVLDGVCYRVASDGEVTMWLEIASSLMQS